MWGALLDGGAIDDLWAEARPKTFFGVSARTLSPEWEVLFLAVHAARHRWQRLKWLVDIHELCAWGEIDWAKVRAKAEHLGWENMLHLTVSVCHALFDTPIPAHLSRIRLPSWIALFPEAPLLQPWQQAFLPLRLLPRPANRVRYLVNLLFLPTPTECRLVRLPTCLAFLYYPLRPLRMVGKWTWRLARAGSQRLWAADKGPLNGGR